MLPAETSLPAKTTALYRALPLADDESMISSLGVPTGNGSLMLLTGLAGTIYALGVYIAILELTSLLALGQLLWFPGKWREYARQCPLRRRRFVVSGVVSLFWWPVFIVCGYLARVVSYWFLVPVLLGGVLAFVLVNPYDKRARAAGEPTWAQWKLLNAAESKPQSGTGGESA